jgi:hypothetical protein
MLAASQRRQRKLIDKPTLAFSSAEKRSMTAASITVSVKMSCDKNDKDDKAIHSTPRLKALTVLQKVQAK